MEKEVILKKLSYLRDVVADIEMDPEDREDIETLIKEIEEEVKK
jgi:CRISPR/Cas system-associated exonuclease Cas4 (RecB family)